VADVLQGSAGRWAVYLGKRLAGAILAIFGVVVLTFVVTHVLGDPTRLILGNRATQAQYVAERHKLGYDRSVLAQFGSYIGQLVQGNLGVSALTEQSVIGQIGHRLPVTLELVIASMLLGICWTIPLGIISARRPGGVVDRLCQGLVEFGVAMPSFWFGLLLILVFVAALHIAPTPIGQLSITATPPPTHTGFMVIDSLIAGQWGNFGSALGHLVLPAVTLSITSCPPILQLTRNGMIQNMRSDYVRAARALGLRESRVRWYAFKNALVPVTTMTAMTFGYLIGGAVLVEEVFAWPGIGLYAVQSMQNFDYQPVLGVVIVTSAIFVLVYLLADIFTLIVDPRVREST
jgi:peptide/nickel transport system permease protein